MSSANPSSATYMLHMEVSQNYTLCETNTGLCMLSGCHEVSEEGGVHGAFNCLKVLNKWGKLFPQLFSTNSSGFSCLLFASFWWSSFWIPGVE